MKQIFRLSFLFTQIIVLAGCIPVGVSSQPTQEIQFSSHTKSLPTVPTISTLTPTSLFTVMQPIATLSQPTTPTPLITLNPEEEQATIEPLIRNPLNCAAPCFWGVIPGKTSIDQAKAFFNRLGLQTREGEDFYSIGYRSSNARNFSATFYTSNNLVENIEITPEIIIQKEGNPREWIAYSPETLIKKFGTPSRVYFALDWGPNFVITMIMYFDNLDLIALYSGYNMIPSRPRSPLVCPLTAPFDLVRLWMGPFPPDPPLFPMQPLEKVTSLSIDQFAQLMLGDPDQACFIVNGDVFQ